MPQLSDFHFGAAVVASDGRKVGVLVRVVVEEEGFDPRALVVREEESFAGRLLAAESFRVTDEVVIPLAGVESATHDLVRLSLSAPEVRRQPPYLGYHFKPLTTKVVVSQTVALVSGGPGVPNLEETAAKAAGEVEIDRGENVMLGKTGRRLGHVQDVLYAEGELIGVVVRPDGFFKRDVMLPTRFISRADDMALFCHLDEADIDHLRPFVDGSDAASQP